jgi:hypothetical protein
MSWLRFQMIQGNPPKPTTRPRNPAPKPLPMPVLKDKKS